MRALRSIFLLAVIAASFSFPVMAQKANVGEKLPRTVLAFYDNDKFGSPRYSYTHEFLEMPLNRLGYVVQYHNIEEPLPELTDEIIGVVVWFHPEIKIKHERVDAWMDWLDGVVAKEKKLILIGSLGLVEQDVRKIETQDRINRIMHYIGVHENFQWHSLLHDAKIIHATRGLTGFERKFTGVLPAFVSTSVWESGGGVSHLRINTPQYEDYKVSDLVITSPNGGYIAEDYAVYRKYDKGELVLSAWYVNPFDFLRIVLDDLILPKADVTTMNGNRIFYGHMDGDGWNNFAEMEEYKNKKKLASEVVLEKIFKKYNEYAFSVGFIVSDLRTDCYGIPASKEVAKKMLKLPNVEAGSHTYSHPLAWRFFATKDANEREEEYADKFPSKPQEKFILTRLFMPDSKELNGEYALEVEGQFEHPLRGITNPELVDEDIYNSYETPRSYACEPFSLDREIRGSIDYINNLMPGKKVKLYQWSGDTTPFEAALREVRKNGIYNINGGDSRFDTEYPSYTSVSSIGVQIGNERQIYSSNSNENTYTNLWTDRFFGFKYLQSTIENTEVPVRVDPFNVYFHTYSGQKLPSLTALQHNLDYARTKNLTPVFASEYAAIANNFSDVEFWKLGDKRWMVNNRGALNTVRFDEAVMQRVDFEDSKGVIGQNYHQASLYVALDPEEKQPVIALKERREMGSYPQETIPYVIRSNWGIKDLQVSKKSLTFRASGFGELKAVLKMPQCADYHVLAKRDERILMDVKSPIGQDCKMELTIAPQDNEEVTFAITDTR